MVFSWCSCAGGRYLNVFGFIWCARFDERAKGGDDYPRQPRRQPEAHHHGTQSHGRHCGGWMASPGESVYCFCCFFVGMFELSVVFVDYVISLLICWSIYCFFRRLVDVLIGLLTFSIVFSSVRCFARRSVVFFRRYADLSVNLLIFSSVC